MKALVQMLIESQATIRWFAMGEAVRLDGEISKAVEDYHQSKAKATKRQVRETVDKVASFLARQGTRDAQEIGRKLRINLDRLKLEEKQ